jgi:NTE family protein
MKSNETRTRALVFGGGGVAGISWELGILIGLHDTGVDVRGADVIIGTSAGSVVGAQIASGTDLESLFASQLTPVEQSKERMVAFDPVQMMEEFSQAVAAATRQPSALAGRTQGCELAGSVAMLWSHA